MFRDRDSRGARGDYRPEGTLIQKLIGLAAAAIIFMGTRYSIEREHLRSPEYIQAQYQKIDHKFFNDDLPDVHIYLGELSVPDRLGETRLDERGFTIGLDTRSSGITSEELMTVVLRHEMCHIQTYLESEAEGDAHGVAFKNCMRRYE